MSAPTPNAACDNSGFALARTLTRQQVGVVREIFLDVARRLGRPPLTLLAIGGTGLRMQSPRSDFDLALIHQDVPDHSTLGIIESVTADFVGELYQCRMEIGARSVFSIGEAVRCCQHDFRTLSALISARYIAGDRRLVRAFERARDASLSACRDNFFAWLVADRSRRHRLATERSQPDEPDLKNGPGGLRDAQQVLWIARALGHPTLARAVQAGLLTPRRARRYRRALEDLIHLRYALHSVSGDCWPRDVLYRSLRGDLEKHATEGGAANLLQRLPDVQAAIRTSLDALLEAAGIEPCTPSC